METGIKRDKKIATDLGITIEELALCKFQVHNHYCHDGRMYDYSTVEFKDDSPNEIISKIKKNNGGKRAIARECEFEVDLSGI
ncbi:MAG: hypothetical protein GY821_06545 [Gammaproteobacteria bacterium]|nr:hypothetical protein [Gammaproteobacteria bacterium]